MATATQDPQFMTIGEVGQHFGIQGWMVRRLFERKLLPEPIRGAGVRLIPRADLSKIQKALQEAGYLSVN